MSDIIDLSPPTMPRPKKNEINLDKIGKLKISPEKKPGIFVESKINLRRLIKPPPADSAGDDIHLFAIHCDRENEVMLGCQKTLIEEGQRTKYINAKRIEEIYKMNANLRQQFAEVNSFFKDCEDKKKFATRTIAKEKGMHDELKAEIRTHRKAIKELSVFRDQIKETVREMEPYERVMQEVITNSKAYSSEMDCVQRLDALMLVQTEIDTMKEAKMHEIEEKRKHMSNLATEASIAVLGYINKLAELERDFDQAKYNCLKWEKILANIKCFLVDTDSTRRRIVAGVDQMFFHLCKRREMTIVRVEFETQMEFIREEINILKKVLAECLQYKKLRQ